MKIEEGKFYRSDCGEKIGPLRSVTSVDRFSWAGASPDGTKFRFSTDGHCSNGWTHSFLVEEWFDEPERNPVQPVTKASLLDAAKAAVADRGLNYGKPEDNFRRIAELWSTHIKNRYAQTTNEYGNDMSAWDGMLDPGDVAMMMALMKIARLENDPAHLDSWTDIAGYAACGAEITNGTENSV